jgi:hypothetical protein
MLHQMELSSWLVHLFHLGLSPWNHIGACWITLCFFLCSGVIWAGSGGGTHSTTRTVLEGGGGPSVVPNGTFLMVHLSTWVWSLEPCWCLLDHFVWFSVQLCYLGLDLGRTHSTTWNGLGRWWRSFSCTNGTIPHGWSTFHLGLGPWNQCGACWITLCGFLCSGVILAGSGGRTHSTTRTVSWKVVEVLPLYQMELFWLVNLSTWVLESWNHVWCWITLWFSVQWCYLWLDHSGRTPPHTWNGLGRWWRSFFCTRNYSSWLVHLSTWVLEPLLVPVGSLCVVFCALVLFGLDLVGRTHSTTRTVLEGGGGPSLVPNGTIPVVGQPFHLVTLEPYWCLLDHFVWFFWAV